MKSICFALLLAMSALFFASSAEAARGSRGGSGGKPGYRGSRPQYRTIYRRDYRNGGTYIEDSDDSDYDSDSDAYYRSYGRGRSQGHPQRKHGRR